MVYGIFVFWGSLETAIDTSFQQRRPWRIFHFMDFPNSHSSDEFRRGFWSSSSAIFKPRLDRLEGHFKIAARF